MKRRKRGHAEGGRRSARPHAKVSGQPGEAGAPITIQTVQNLFAAAARRRLCMIVAYPSYTAVPEPGTGTAVSHGEELFIVTCEHVARDLFAMPAGELLFDGQPRLSRDKCSVIFADRKLDLAVLHVHASAARQLAGVVPLSIGDLGDERAFTRATARSACSYVVTGFPGALASIQGRAISLFQFVVGTEVKSRRGSRLVLDYEHGVKDGKPLPPNGISGGLAHEMYLPVDRQVWRPGVAVAVQHAWNEVKRELYCSPVHLCREPIEKFVAKRSRGARVARKGGRK